MTPTLIEDMRSMRAEGHSLRFIADQLGVGRGTVEKYVKAMPRSGRALPSVGHTEDVIN
jgi:transposase